MRAYIRHPTDVPLNVKVKNPPVRIHGLKDVSEGGLCFHSDKKLPKGTVISISIPVNNKRYEESCVVVWCRPSKKGYETGVRFQSSESAFRARMVEQICYIEKYRKEQLGQGRELAWSEAAEEWIARYGASFPDFNKSKK